MSEFARVFHMARVSGLPGLTRTMAACLIAGQYPHPAPDGWPFPVWRDAPYQAPARPLKPAPF